MEQLAQAGGITKPILYRHFGDRDGLVDAMAERFVADLLTTVTTPLAGDATTLDLLRSTVDSYVGVIERETSLYRFMMQQSQIRLGGAPRVRSLIDRIARQVADVASERLRLDGRDASPAVPWAYGIVGMVHQAGDWWVDDKPISRSALVAYLVTLIWDGVGPAPADPSEA